MEKNNYFSENWIVLFGVVLILVTFYKYENDPNVKKVNSIEIQNKISSKKNLKTDEILTSTERSPSNENTEQSQAQSDSVYSFDSSSMFKKAIANMRPPKVIAIAPNSIVTTQHRLLHETPWKIWNNTRVLKNSELIEQEQALANVSNLSIVATTENTDLSNFDSSKKAVVYDERLKKPGIITGVIKVQVSDKERLKEDLKNWQAELSDEFDSINTYFVTSQNKIFNLEALYENLKSRDYIIEAELEIIRGIYNKN